MENLNFQFDYRIPELSDQTKKKYCNEAIHSKKRRHPLIIHNHGDEFNQVFNFICSDSYMRPHMHPSGNMVEKMHLIEGSFELFFFDNTGSVIKTYLLDKPGQRVMVPAFQLHTYIMKSDLTIIYETMIGKYDPITWKKMAEWSPEEGTHDSKVFFDNLKNFKQ